MDSNRFYACSIGNVESETESGAEIEADGCGGRDCYTKQNADSSLHKSISLQNIRELREVRALKISSGQRWRCQNDACGCEITVMVSSKLEGDNPRCSCGSVMKKPYTKPQLRNLPASADLELIVCLSLGVDGKE